MAPLWCSPFVEKDHGARTTLPQGVVEPFDMIGFPHLLRDGCVALRRNDTVQSLATHPRRARAGLHSGPRRAPGRETGCALPWMPAK